jgi:serine protease Do
MSASHKSPEVETTLGRSRFYHFLIVGGATVVLSAGGLWQGGRNGEAQPSSELSAIEALKKEVSGVRSVLMRNELETVHDATQEILDAVAASIISVQPSQPIEPVREVPVYGLPAEEAGLEAFAPAPASVSGLLIDPQGYAVTSATVGSYGSEVRIVFGESTGSADVIAVDPQHHLALIKAREIPSGARPVAPGSVTPPRSGDWLIGAARALSGAAVASLHVFDSIRGDAAGKQIGILASSATAQMDGAVLVNLRRQIVGLYARPRQAEGFAIPIALALEIAAGLKARPAPEIYGWAGFVLQDLTDDMREYFRASSGVLVASVDVGGPAATAGLRAMDLIQSIRSEQVASAAAAMTIVNQSTPDTPLPVTIQRSRATRQLELRVGSPPASTTDGPQADGETVFLELGLAPQTQEGALIMSAVPTAYFARIGITPGDLLLSVNGTRLSNPEQFWRLQARRNAAEPQLWRLSRQGREFFVALKTAVGRQ